MKVFKVLLPLFLLSTTTQAAVIFSNCPVMPTDSTRATSSVDRFRPDELALGLRRYTQEFPQAARYFHWFFSDRQKPASALTGSDQAMRQAGWVWEDLQFVTALAGKEVTCHVNKKSLTTPYAIFPFVMRVKDAGGGPSIRVRYKLCEYYVDNQRQLPFENECKVLGRETGYTFAELEQRFGILRDHVDTARRSMNGLTYAVGAVATLTSFRLLRFLELGNFAALSFAALPAGAAYLAVEKRWIDEFTRNLSDFKDAAEIAISGDLTTSVAVSIPMEDFTPYFVRYLESLDSSVESP